MSRPQSLKENGTHPVVPFSRTEEEEQQQDAERLYSQPIGRDRDDPVLVNARDDSPQELTAVHHRETMDQATIAGAGISLLQVMTLDHQYFISSRQHHVTMNAIYRHHATSSDALENIVLQPRQPFTSPVAIASTQRNYSILLEARASAPTASFARPVEDQDETGYDDSLCDPITHGSGGGSGLIHTLRSTLAYALRLCDQERRARMPGMNCDRGLQPIIHLSSRVVGGSHLIRSDDCSEDLLVGENDEDNTSSSLYIGRTMSSVENFFTDGKQNKDNLQGPPTQ